MITAKVDLGNLDKYIENLSKTQNILNDNDIIKKCVDKAFQTLNDFTINESLMRSTAFLGNADGWRELGYYHWSNGDRTASHNRKEIISGNEGRIYNDQQYMYEIEFGCPFPYDYELDEETYQRYVKNGYPESFPNAEGKYEGHTDGYEGLGIFRRTDLTLETELDELVAGLVAEKINKIMKE